VRAQPPALPAVASFRHHHLFVLIIKLTGNMSAPDMAATAVIARLYAAFEKLDGLAMQACYSVDARFDDEAFGLQGREEIGGMWRMLCDATRNGDTAAWRLEVSDITDHSAHWEAHYRFSATGRLVHNIIDAEFEFGPDGLIQQHRDHFSFWRWSRQALGAPGLMLGWTPFLRRKVRAGAAANLAKYLAAEAPDAAAEQPPAPEPAATEEAAAPAPAAAELPTEPATSEEAAAPAPAAAEQPTEPATSEEAAAPAPAAAEQPPAQEPTAIAAPLAGDEGVTPVE